MRARGASRLVPALRVSAGCLPPGSGAVAAAAAPGPGVVSASIEVGAPIHEALHHWSEFSGVRQPGAWQVDFEPGAGSRSRVTLELEQRSAVPGSDALRRVLEAHLVAFEGFVARRARLRCATARY